MDEYESLSHTKWDCKYHVILIPKCRRRMIYVELRPHLARRDQGGMSRDQKRLWRVMFTFL
jgi:putative transposase